MCKIPRNPWYGVLTPGVCASKKRSRDPRPYAVVPAQMACKGSRWATSKQVDNEVSKWRQIPGGGLNSEGVHGKSGWEVVVVVAVAVVDGDEGWAAAWLWWVGVVVLSWLLCGGVGVVVAEKF